MKKNGIRIFIQNKYYTNILKEKKIEDLCFQLIICMF